jgi:hypothetical protein
VLVESFAGRIIDDDFFDNLPAGVDPYGKMESSIRSYSRALFLINRSLLRQEKRFIENVKTKRKRGRM